MGMNVVGVGDETGNILGFPVFSIPSFQIGVSNSYLAGSVDREPFDPSFRGGPEDEGEGC